MSSKRIINFNLGILGHVDSGKTTLAKHMSTQASTAAFDKHPESQKRGITIDLGFSAMLVEVPDHLKEIVMDIEKMQITLVDCPGHASLIRTILGGAQIIDMMLLVVDAQKGFQTQTSECLLIGELTCEKLFVVINKIDCLEEVSRDKSINKLKFKISKILENTKFGKKTPIYSISALKMIGVEEFLNGLKQHLFLPARDSSKPFLFYVDHCFPIKGQGTVCTGTVIDGKIRVQQNIEIPYFKQQRKVKSIQMFNTPVQSAIQGDRIGICVSQFNSDQMERGIIAETGYIRNIYAGIINFHKIKYFKYSIKSKTKFHITIGHETVMAKILIFKQIIRFDNSKNVSFSMKEEYEYIDEIPTENDQNGNNIYALLEFENPVLTTLNALIIASKLDIKADSNVCRIAFWGNLLWSSDIPNYLEEELKNLKIYRNKSKQSSIQRVVNENEIIVQNLFTKESKREVFMGKTIVLNTGEKGFIESSFGQSSKVKIRFYATLKQTTLDRLKNKNNDVLVFLNYKKYLFGKINKNM